MSKARLWPPEWKDYTDPHTGVKICQLTNYTGHSHHLYFTNPGWYDHARRLVFGSDRENRTNLFSIDLQAGEIVQLTDLKPVQPPRETQFLTACVNPTCDVAYFWHDREMVALDLGSLERRTLWEMPTGFVHTMSSCTADGKYICAGTAEDLSDRVQIDRLRGRGGFRETWQARPLSRIVRIAADGTAAETVWEEQSWIGHVNTSPTQPNLITFCHEGPWHEVDNRIWGLDLNTGQAWMIRPREGEETVGHEYWLADGVHIGYHGRWPDQQKLFGKIQYDNTHRVETKLPHDTGHMHSNDFSLIAGDGGHQVQLWQYNGEQFEGPRVLCEHRSSFHIQQVHVHPRFSLDGSHVLFTSDSSGYGNLYLAHVTDFESLPEIEEPN